MATCFPPPSTVVLVTRVLWVAALLAPVTVAAQSTTATILGTVTDSSGAVLPGVAVTIVNEGTNSQRTVTTDGTGGYEAPLLPPGAYRVEGELTGFKKIIRSGITLQVDQRARVDLMLDLGAVTETIEVRADAPLVQSESAGIGTVVDNAKIVELPLNGRDFFQLSTLVTGAAPPAEGSQNATQGGGVSVNGAREQSNNFLLDGIDNNSLAINQIVIPPSVDAVQEFKVQSSTLQRRVRPERRGRSSTTSRGAAPTRSTDRRTSSCATPPSMRRTSSTAPIATIPQYQRNQFGGTFGGPIRRDKLFFFGNYEGARIRQAFTRVATVPPTAWVNGDFSSLLTGVVDPDLGFDPGQLFDPRTFEPIAGNVITPEMMDSAGAEIVKWYPAPDDPNATGPSSAVVAPVGRNDINQLTARVDHNVGRDDRLFYRYSLWDEDRFNPFDPLADPTNVPGFGSSTLNNGQSLAVGWTRTLGSRMVNEFRFGFNRLHAGIFQEHRGNDVSASLGITGLLTDPNAVGRPGIVVGITDPLLEATNLPQDRIDKTLQFNDSLSWLRGPPQPQDGRRRAAFRAGFLSRRHRARAVHLRRPERQPHCGSALRRPSRSAAAESREEHAHESPDHRVQLVHPRRLEGERRSDAEHRPPLRLQQARHRHPGSAVVSRFQRPERRVPPGGHRRAVARRLRRRIATTSRLASAPPGSRFTTPEPSSAAATASSTMSGS